MAYLPRHQADEVATKADIARLEGRFDRLDAGLDQMQRTYVVTTVASLTAMAAIFSLVVTFLTERSVDGRRFDQLVNRYTRLRPPEEEPGRCCRPGPSSRMARASVRTLRSRTPRCHRSGRGVHR